MGETSCTFVFGWNLKSTTFSLLFDEGHFTFKSFLQVLVVSNVLIKCSGLYCVRTHIVVVCFPVAESTVIKGSATMNSSKVSLSCFISS